MVQRKALYRQVIPESNCARRETVVIDILIKSTNGDRINHTICSMKSSHWEKEKRATSASSDEDLPTQVIPTEKT